jgi:hypothetical protein
MRAPSVQAALLEQLEMKVSFNKQGLLKKFRSNNKLGGGERTGGLNGGHKLAQRAGDTLGDSI